MIFAKNSQHIFQTWFKVTYLESRVCLLENWVSLRLGGIPKLFKYRKITKEWNSNKVGRVMLLNLCYWRLSRLECVTRTLNVFNLYTVRKPSIIQVKSRFILNQKFGLIKRGANQICKQICGRLSEKLEIGYSNESDGCWTRMKWNEVTNINTLSPTLSYQYQDVINTPMLLTSLSSSKIELFEPIFPTFQLGKSNITSVRIVWHFTNGFCWVI